MSTEDTGRAFCFEIITKHRIFQLSAKTHQEMVEWMTVLSTHTILQAENEYIKQAEEMIAKTSFDRYVQETGATLEMLSVDVKEFIETETRRRKEAQLENVTQIDTDENVDPDQV
jgi:hypothetical protein